MRAVAGIFTVYVRVSVRAAHPLERHLHADALAGADTGGHADAAHERLLGRAAELEQHETRGHGGGLPV